MVEISRDGSGCLLHQFDLQHVDDQFSRACRAYRSWPTPSPAAGSSWTRVLSWSSSRSRSRPRGRRLLDPLERPLPVTSGGPSDRRRNLRHRRCPPSWRLGCLSTAESRNGVALRGPNGMRRGSAVFAAVPPIAAGHVRRWRRCSPPFAARIRIAGEVKRTAACAGCLLIGLAIYKLVDLVAHPAFPRTHRPGSTWCCGRSLMATAHGAG